MMRNIHDRTEMSKFFWLMVTLCVKETIFRNMSIYQIAFRPGHCPSEHIFVVKSILASFKEQKKGLIASGYDLRKFFDFEELSDCMDSLYKRGIKGKLYKLIFEMNKTFNIKVKTLVGTSREEKTDPIVAQGSVEAAIISSNNVDVGVTEKFDDNEREIEYADVKLNPLSFMDDIFRLAGNASDAQYGNDMIELMVHEKNLQFNHDKSSYILMGSAKARKKLRTELERNPLTLEGKRMKEVKELKYLGEILSHDLADSVHKTVVKRLGIASYAAHEARAVVEDTRSDKLGGINIGFQILEAAILPMILHNAEVWMEIPRKTLNILDNFLNNFFRKMFRIGSGCPIANFYWQTGFLKAGNLILMKKLNMYHHLSNLPEESLGRIILDIQVSKDLPGLHRELKEHLDRISVEDIHMIPKSVWKRKVKEYITEIN